jgi:internalin A
MTNRPVNIFISYSSKDTDLVVEFIGHLVTLERTEKIKLYYDGRVTSGEASEGVLYDYISKADIVLFMLSPDSLSSDDVNHEIIRAIEKKKEKGTKIISVFLRHCDWKSSPLAKFQFLNNPERPVAALEHSERDSAFTEIFKTLAGIVDMLSSDWIEKIKKEFEERTGTLNLAHCGLAELPEEIVDMDWLTSLILNNNEIKDIILLGKLTNLKSLNLAENRITDISIVNSLPILRYLNLIRNKVATIESEISCPELEILYLAFNDIKKAPIIFSLLKLRELNLSGNEISELWTFMFPPNLAILNLSENSISEIHSLVNLKKLVSLDLTGNQIIKIEGIDTLKKLEYLDLQKNEIAVIENLEQNHKLKTLGLSGNEITTLQNISHLTNLETLYIANNQIEDITELQNLKNLKRVVLTNNKITDLFPLKEFIENDIPVKDTYSFDAEELGIFIKDNPIQYPPLEVIAEGKVAILRNFMQQEKALEEKLGAYQSTEIKLILLGNANVGKSHIATYIKSRRKKLPPDNASTHGMVNEFVQYKMPALSNPVKMRILDFGGQEYYHDTHHLFFTSDTIYLLLWEKESNRFGTKEEKRFSPATKQLEEETNAVFPVAYWLDAVNYFISKKEEERRKNSKQEGDTTVITVDPAVILVETKRSKKGITVLDNSSLLPFSGLIHSNLSISLYKDTIGKIINTGTDSLFDSMNDLIGSMFEKRWSGYYALITAFFEKINSTENIQLLKQVNAENLMIAIQDCIVLFNSIIKNKGYKYKFDNDNALDLCRFLANRGYILYFDSDRICLHPERLTKEIYEVLNRQYKSVGMIAEKELTGTDPAVVSIMQEFRLIIPHPGTTGYIAPQLLPENTSSQLSMFLDAFKPPVIRFSLAGYIHKNIIQELFYSFREDLVKEETKNYIWKNGFIINIENELYKINIHSTENCRMIEVQYLNEFNRGLLNKISEKISAVLEGRHFTKEVSNDGKLFVPLEEIKKNIQLAQFVFDSKLLRVADYKNFLDDSFLQHAMKKLFISYSSRNTAFMKRFVTHLEPLKRNGAIDFWHDRMIEPGTRWDESIKKELQQANIVIFLLSPDFIANNYIFEVEIPQALKQEGLGTKLFLLELQACSWDKTVLTDYQLATNPDGDNKAMIQIADPQNDTQWKLVIGELEKLLK